MEYLFVSCLKRIRSNAQEENMCGIAGIINKEGMDVSTKLVDMLKLIQHRGPDATGIAVYGAGESITMRVAITDKDRHIELMNIVAEYARIAGESTSDWRRNIVFADFVLEMEQTDIPRLHERINSVDGLCVHYVGRGMRLFKDAGSTTELVEKHRIGSITATHGMGHVRMATESAEDINAAHPFVSPFYPELSVVHNGQFTNYFNLRRSLERRGAIFKTLNDSEAASHLIAWAMKENGGDLKAALLYALEEMDGIFCIIAATSKQMGFVKDRMGIKPFLLFEKDNMTFFGSEQIEFTTVFPDVYAEEMEPGEVRVWNI